MRVCVLYDCIFPWTVGGAERWYRSLAEAYASSGHEVTYLTLRQWPSNDPARINGVRIVAVGPRMVLYARGKRRIAPPLLYGIGVLLHLVRFGHDYDVVHGASFPFFSILAAAAVRPFRRYRITIDWHEVWSRAYWRAYLGRLGWFGWTVQRLCARVPQIGFSFSRLHLQRAQALGVSDMTLLEGEYLGGGEAIAGEASTPPEILYVGRLIPEKRVALLVDALAIAMRERPALRARLIGSGPDRERIEGLVRTYGLAHRIGMPGFVTSGELQNAMSKAAVVVQPSEREGYGMVVVEASARGVPVVVVAGPDNAAVELVEPGINGYVASEANPTALATAIGQAIEGADALRASVRAWYGANSERLSFRRSFQIILDRLSTNGP